MPGVRPRGRTARAIHEGLRKIGTGTIRVGGDTRRRDDERTAEGGRRQGKRDVGRGVGESMLLLLLLLLDVELVLLVLLLGRRAVQLVLVLVGSV